MSMEYALVKMQTSVPEFMSLGTSIQCSVTWTGCSHLENFKASLKGKGESKLRKIRGFSYLQLRPFIDTKSVKINLTFYTL